MTAFPATRARSSRAASGWPTRWCSTARSTAGRAHFERLLALRNDVGLLAEEYDVHAGRQLGNVPQAYSHLALVNSALNLAQVPATGETAPAEQRAARDG